MALNDYFFFKSASRLYGKRVPLYQIVHSTFSRLSCCQTISVIDYVPCSFDLSPPPPSAITIFSRPNMCVVFVCSISYTALHKDTFGSCQLLIDKRQLMPPALLLLFFFFFFCNWKKTAAVLHISLRF